MASSSFFVLSLIPIIVSLFIVGMSDGIGYDNVYFSVQFGLVLTISCIGFLVCVYLIPIVAKLCLSANLMGRDINKASSDTNEKVPESLGLVVGIVYIICVILFQPLFSSMLAEFNAALVSILMMILLGFVDDVLNLRWSSKIGLSCLATLPLLVAYSGPTNIIVPLPFRFWLGYSIQLGPLYLIYMAAISVFCTNSINILAGINGLEVGQSLVIAFSVLIHSIVQLFVDDLVIFRSATLSIALVVPFIMVSLALFMYNKYPSKVFVGDSYTYFAGMTFAVIGILAHFSKTLMLFFIPQLLNFTISVPQLFGIIPCPPHRLPKYNPKTDRLEYVPTHWNLINLVLFLLGPLHEKTLTNVVITFQIGCSLLAFLIRYSISRYFY